MSKHRSSDGKWPDAPDGLFGRPDGPSEGGGAELKGDKIVDVSGVPATTSMAKSFNVNLTSSDAWNVSEPNCMMPTCKVSSISPLTTRYSINGDISSSRYGKSVWDNQVKTEAPRWFTPWKRVLKQQSARSCSRR